jgi:hypothetical protein
MKDKLINVGTCCTVSFHFIVCGLPLIIALLGGTLSFAGVFGKQTMLILLILSGVMIMFSVVSFVRCNYKKRWNLIMIIAVLLLYGIALAGHFGLFTKTTEEVGVMLCH